MLPGLASSEREHLLCENCFQHSIPTIRKDFDSSKNVTGIDKTPSTEKNCSYLFPDL